MKLAVRGGSGRLGTALLRRLLRDRTVKQVVWLDRLPPALPGHKLTAVPAGAGELERHLAGCAALIYLADTESVRCEGTETLLRAVAAAGVPGLVCLLPQRALQKVEALLAEFVRVHDECAVARLRTGLVLGPGMEDPFGQALRHRLLVTAGAAPLSLIWDEDMAEAVVLAARKRVAGDLSLCADALLPAAALARAARMRHVELGPRAAELLGWLGLGQIMSTFAAAAAAPVPSGTSARELLGWRPRYATDSDVLRRYAEVVPIRLDPRLAVFFRLVDFGVRRISPQPELAGLTEAVHLRILGPGGGDLGLVVKDSGLRLLSHPPRPPTAVLELRDQVLLDLLAGRTDMAAVQLTGRVRIDGEPRAAMLLGGIVAAFRQSAGLSGAAGLLGRGLQAWVCRPGSPKEVSSS